MKLSRRVSARQARGPKLDSMTNNQKAEYGLTKAAPTFFRALTLACCIRGSQPPLTAPAVSPATICRCANTVSSSTGAVTISAAAASGPQLNWSNEIML